MFPLIPGTVPLEENCHGAQNAKPPSGAGTVVEDAPIVNGVAQATLILGSTLMLGTLTVFAQVKGGGPTAHATAQVAIVIAPNITVTCPPIVLSYGATQVPVSATFTYLDGSPVAHGTALFDLFGVVNPSVSVLFTNGAASAVLGPFLYATEPIPVGVHSYRVYAIASNLFVYGSGGNTVTVSL